jgi:hypothetical protein
MDLRISMSLATAYGYAGRAHDAVEVYESGYQQLVALGRDRTRLAGAALNNWANPARAEAAARG